MSCATIDKTSLFSFHLDQTDAFTFSRQCKSLEHASKKHMQDALAAEREAIFQRIVFLFRDGQGRLVPRAAIIEGIESLWKEYNQKPAPERIASTEKPSNPETGLWSYKKAAVVSSTPFTFNAASTESAAKKPDACFKFIIAPEDIFEDFLQPDCWSSQPKKQDSAESPPQLSIWSHKKSTAVSTQFTFNPVSNKPAAKPTNPGFNLTNAPEDVSKNKLPLGGSSSRSQDRELSNSLLQKSPPHGTRSLEYCSYPKTRNPPKNGRSLLPRGRSTASSFPKAVSSSTSSTAASDPGSKSPDTGLHLSLKEIPLSARSSPNSRVSCSGKSIRVLLPVDDHRVCSSVTVSMGQNKEVL